MDGGHSICAEVRKKLKTCFGARNALLEAKERASSFLTSSDLTSERLKVAIIASRSRACSIGMDARRKSCCSARKRMQPPYETLQRTASYATDFSFQTDGMLAAGGTVRFGRCLRLGQAVRSS
eukprot:3686323-Pleurochrysis_carterae.AAC.5